jgi:polysaccharide biosynthesis transport protein
MPKQLQDGGQTGLVPVFPNSNQQQQQQQQFAVSPWYFQQIPGAFGGGGPGMEPEIEEQRIPLSHYLWVVRRHAWKIMAWVVLCMLGTFLVSSRLAPVYESTVTIDVDRQAPNAIVGQDAARALSPNDSDQFLATQIRLIQSDSVLRPIAEKYKLLDHEEQTKGLTEGKLRALLTAPVTLKKLTVVRPPNTYLLQVSYRSTDAALAANVANSIARSYLEHTYRIRLTSSSTMSTFMSQQLDELKAKMEQSGQRLAAFERELNVINPEEKTSILSSRLLQLNTEYTNAQSDRVKKEAAFQSLNNGSLEAAQVSSQGDALQKLNDRLNEAKQKLSLTRATWGPNSPEHRKAASDVTELQRQFDETRANIGRRIEVEYRTAVSREDMLRKAVVTTKGEFDSLNGKSFQYQQAKQDADNDKKIYDELLRKIKEAEINSGIQNNNVRIADPARAGARPVFPNIRLNMLLALLFAALLGIGGALLSDLLDNTITDPEQAARVLNTDIVGGLPAIKLRDSRSAGQLNAPAGALVKFAESSQEKISGYEEAIRTLRNSILLGDFDRRMRSLLVTSASPGEGKTTTAVHLAISHSQQHKKTLLIDADLRRPSVHKKMQIPANVGLSNYLTENLSWKDVMVKDPDYPDLDVIAAGPPSRKASDLIGPRMVDLLEEASREYDLVIVDAPPLLGFAEPLQMATCSDGVLVVTRAGTTSRKAVGSVLATLKRLRANVVGVVLNQVKPGMSDHYYYYGYSKNYYMVPNAGPEPEPEKS